MQQFLSLSLHLSLYINISNQFITKHCFIISAEIIDTQKQLQKWGCDSQSESILSVFHVKQNHEGDQRWTGAHQQA